MLNFDKKRDAVEELHPNVAIEAELAAISITCSFTHPLVNVFA